MQISLHTCSKALKREFDFVFQHAEKTPKMTLFALATWQNTNNDLVDYGGDVAVEKDECLLHFTIFAKFVKSKLSEMGYWCDYVDPCSGLPMNTPQGAGVYSEVNGMRSLLGYSMVSAAGCSVIEHPVWGTKCYPATIFLTAPQEIIEKIIFEFHDAAREQNDDDDDDDDDLEKNDADL